MARGVLCRTLARSRLDTRSRIGKDQDETRLDLTSSDGAEGVGFEPTVGLHLLRFSRPSQANPNTLQSSNLGCHVHPSALNLPYDRIPSDLALVIQCWASLPLAMRSGIVAMVKASGGGHQDPTADDPG